MLFDDYKSDTDSETAAPDSAAMNNPDDVEKSNNN
jgi:hypothetical protein